MISSHAAVKYYHVTRRDLFDLPIRREENKILYRKKDIEVRSIEKHGGKIKFRQAVADERIHRREKLSTALAEKGLPLRMDGFLCTTYIKNGDTEEWPLAAVVRRMCEVRFLYDYTRYEDLYQTMIQWAKHEHPESDFNKRDIQKKAEELVLGTLPGKTWPARWPWLGTFKEMVLKY